MVNMTEFMEIEKATLPLKWMLLVQFFHMEVKRLPLSPTPWMRALVPFIQAKAFSFLFVKTLRKKKKDNFRNGWGHAYYTHLAEL